jgi:hypothetical protein
MYIIINTLHKGGGGGGDYGNNNNNNNRYTDVSQYLLTS